jgi:hypothetical protein
MTIKNYIQDKLNESVENKQKQTLLESIKPYIANELREAAKNSKDKKIKVEDLVKTLMDNEKFKEKTIEFLSNDKSTDFNWTANLGDKKYTKLDNLSNGAKRRTVSQRLKDEKIKYAPLAEKLWPEMSPDAARSWFSKKVDGKNERFSDEEVAQLYLMLNNPI